MGDSRGPGSSTQAPHLDAKRCALLKQERERWVNPRQAGGHRNRAQRGEGPERSLAKRKRSKSHEMTRQVQGQEVDRRARVFQINSRLVDPKGSSLPAGQAQNGGRFRGQRPRNRGQELRPPDAADRFFQELRHSAAAEAIDELPQFPMCQTTGVDPHTDKRCVRTPIREKDRDMPCRHDAHREKQQKD